MRLAVVKAARGEDGGIWHVERADIEGLHVEGDTFEVFCENVAAAASDLQGKDTEIPIEIGCARIGARQDRGVNARTGRSARRTEA